MDSEKLKTSLEKSRSQALKELQNLRGEIEQINDEIHWLNNAPLPLDDALVNIDRFIKNYSDASSVEQFFHERKIASPGVFDTKVDFDRMIIDPSGSERIINAAANVADVLIPIFGDTMRRHLHDMAKREASNIESGPPLAERPQLKADLLKRRYALEVEEEALICATEDLGMAGFYRRSDVNPEVVLMMEVEDEPVKANV
ncbi:hypothetical protein Q9L42_010500 [Methylomarinum sp. Ch1-1]|uniref:Uncharacterized protein n=1 Tax=Methylomarinum roseum TaxID=3067653 RepID=A0AAU7NQ30_9GAMM|nr:hypothetical protein [Methylomarinum sp. Ch1-1]MDP4521314.1 hypothetical protein [Methylomarinum sp. Ch1-1]